MQRVKLIFCSEDNDSETQLQAYCNNGGNLYLEINDPDVITPAYITLDLPTAKALLKHLRTEIKFMEDGEE